MENIMVDAWQIYLSILGGWLMSVLVAYWKGRKAGYKKGYVKAVNDIIESKSKASDTAVNFINAD